MLKETNVGCVSTGLMADGDSAHGMLPLAFGLFSLSTLILSVRLNWSILLLAPLMLWFVVVPLWDKSTRGGIFRHLALVGTRGAHYEVTLVALLSLFGLLLVGTMQTASLLTMFGLGVSGGLLVTVAWHGVQRCDENSTVGNLMRRILCAVMLMPHFGVDTREGHATAASTPRDFASARMGESYYSFVYRYFSGAIARGWCAEKSRLDMRGSVYALIHNEMLQILTLSSLYLVAAWTFGGAGLILLVFTQALVAVWQLTAAEYVEHYGMLRKRFPDGEYAPLQRDRYWRAEGAVNNMLLSERQFHGPTDGDPTSSLSEAAPQPTLPLGFNVLSLLVLTPNYWFNFADEKLALLANFDLKRVNLDGDAYVELMERFHKPEQ